jgi:hypothetical protein
LLEEITQLRQKLNITRVDRDYEGHEKSWTTICSFNGQKKKATSNNCSNDKIIACKKERIAVAEQ